MKTIETEMNLFKNKLIEMTQETYQAIENSYNIINKQDRKLSREVIAHDEKINNLEIEINNLAIEILSLLHPVAKDLRYILAGLKITTDLERIADYAKSIAKSTLQEETPEIYQSLLLPFHQIMLDNIRETCELIKNPDIDKAYKCAAKDLKLDEAFSNFKDEIYFNIKPVDQIPYSIFDIARVIERAGDHSKNICEQIIYLLDGEILDFN